jgi:uncharacterized protein (DUF1501 family)
MAHTRRDFLRQTLGGSTLLALAPTAPVFLGRTALAAAPRRDDRDTILVVVQLAGGNDGLNTVVPHGDDQYHKARPTLRIPAGEVRRIDGLLGLHPRLEALHRLYQDGLLGIVQGVGYPNPQGGHFESMHVWQTADPSRQKDQTGWLGRAIDWATRDDPALVPGVYVGQIDQPFTLNARRSIVPTIRTPKDSVFQAPFESRLAESQRNDTNPLLDFVRRSSLAAYRDSRQIEAAAGADSAGAADYPSFQLARTLRVVAQLIRSDVGIRIYYTELGGVEPGGFDNHAGQAENHAALLHQLSESVAAFVRDLKRDSLLDRVLLMTFSEFGRTVRENGRRGTDHGSAAPLFLAGGRLRGGLAGPHPNLTDLENGGQKFHTDFRRVYATLLDRWLGFDSTAVLGARFEPVDVLST